MVHVGFISGTQGWSEVHQRLSVTHHMTRRENDEDAYTAISVDAFGRVQRQFMLEDAQQNRCKRRRPPHNGGHL